MAHKSICNVFLLLLLLRLVAFLGLIYLQSWDVKPGRSSLILLVTHWGAHVKSKNIPTSYASTQAETMNKKRKSFISAFREKLSTAPPMHPLQGNM